MEDKEQERKPSQPEIVYGFDGEIYPYVPSTPVELANGE